MKTIVHNRKAKYEYFIQDTYIAGIQLMGTEVKSVRNNQVSITEAFCQINNNIPEIIGMHIAPYMAIKHTNHEPNRVRKLLLNKKEIKKIAKIIDQENLTLIPIDVLISDTGLIKLKIAICKGKKNHDKRNSIREKEVQREIKINL